MLYSDFLGTVRAQHDALGVTHMIVDFLQHVDNSLQIRNFTLVNQRIGQVLSILSGNQHVIDVATLLLAMMLVCTSWHHYWWFKVV